VIDPREALASGLESLRHHALRSLLAMLGIIFGVGAVIAMLSIGAGAERQVLVEKIEVEPWKVLSSTERAKPRVIGVSSDYPALVRVDLSEGRFFDRHDEETHTAATSSASSPPSGSRSRSTTSGSPSWGSSPAGGRSARSRASPSRARRTTSTCP
jgi:hypothetical protein